MSAPLRFCLVGARVARSPSAAMHNAALRACGITAVYENREVAPEQLRWFVDELRAGAYAGCNVTIPYKAALAAECDRLDGDAELLGVVNTITVEGHRLIGDNTDADGFELGLSVARMWPRPGSGAVVLGAGGAAAAVALALSRAPLSRLCIAARRLDGARSLAGRMAALAPVDPLAWDSGLLRDRLRSAAIVVNATPVGLDDLPLHPQDLPASCTVADVRYRPPPIDLVEAALATGHRACDGREMLLQQGMLSLFRWTGVDPPWAAARQALNAELAP